MSGVSARARAWPPASRRSPSTLQGTNTIIVAQGANGMLGPEDVLRALERLPAADVVLIQLEIPLDAVAAAAATAARIVLNPAPARPLPDRAPAAGRRARAEPAGAGRADGRRCARDARGDRAPRPRSRRRWSGGRDAGRARRAGPRRRRGHPRPRAGGRRDRYDGRGRRLLRKPGRPARARPAAGRRGARRRARRQRSRPRAPGRWRPSRAATRSARRWRDRELDDPGRG